MKANGLQFTLGQIVYFRANNDSSGQITGVITRWNGISYLVRTSEELVEMEVYSQELTEEKSYAESRDG